MVGAGLEVENIPTTEPTSSMHEALYVQDILPLSVSEFPFCIYRTTFDLHFAFPQIFFHLMLRGFNDVSPETAPPRLVTSPLVTQHSAHYLIFIVDISLIPGLRSYLGLARLLFV